VVESTRSAATRSEASSSGYSGVPACSSSIAARMASTRIPFLGWRNRARSQNVSVK
jgi:hypothetical protein